MRRLYVLPASPDDVSLREWLPQLSPYGIDITFMSQEVLNSFLGNEKQMPSAGLINYISEVLSHQFETNFQTTEPGIHMRRAYEEEVDRMAVISMDACSVLYEHLKKHFIAIEDNEASLGTRTQVMDWEIAGVLGSDIVVAVSDDEE